MTLRDYLHERRIKRGDFARLAGIAPQNLSAYINGRKNPSYETAMLIQNASNGLVTLADWPMVRVPVKGRVS